MADASCVPAGCVKPKNHMRTLLFPLPRGKLILSRVQSFLSCLEVPMRVSRFVSIVAGFAVAVPLLPAQANLPYTATWTQTSVQTLADGTTITRQTTTKFARDSSGRTYSEMHNQLPIGANGQQRESVFYFVNDPVVHTNMNWNSNSKQAILFHQPTQALVAQPALPVARSTTSQANTQTATKPDPNFQREDLGTKNIAGVNAKGVRTTRIIPVGQIGNDQPITVVNETWRSPEYGLILMSTREDPRFGKTTREVTDFEPGDPDPSLFQAPQGYSVRDVTPHVATAEVQ